ncbi:hypothetical protein BDA99DRAFT_569506 [Phascolomyces articulosus]|uniref:Heterokaryon incompatibility domain-containing protein n=1 Tax=Phascolomyces articulosus TaxID=60185 RepID=A0AAD5KI51_9FUNG|nr:hypothetical protein BDA99DRAFT_569506 [Phascolomyces articulosus]
MFIAFVYWIILKFVLFTWWVLCVVAVGSEASIYHCQVRIGWKIPIFSGNCPKGCITRVTFVNRSAAVNQTFNDMVKKNSYYQNRFDEKKKIMYITYETAQYSPNDKHERAKRVKPSKKIPNDLPKPDFMPTKLVRISDMTVVNGSQVNEGYCTLSYSWNQSGDIVLDETTGKYKRIDEGKHEIISYDNIYPDMIIPYYKTLDNKRFNKIYQVLVIMDGQNYYFSKTVQYVKFEGIIQQICQQFNIKYIWYDQLCINQDDKEEKHHEIRNMHHIYENAYCTVALVPEYSTKESLSASKQQYFKRLWTLEEVTKSKRLLFVGRNSHQFPAKFSITGDTRILLRPLSQLSVSQILYHAHQRTSTKDHDRVFALIHLFPEFIDHKDEPQSFKKLTIRHFCDTDSNTRGDLMIHWIESHQLKIWNTELVYGKPTFLRTPALILRTVYPPNSPPQQLRRLWRLSKIKGPAVKEEYKSTISNNLQALNSKLQQLIDQPQTQTTNHNVQDEIEILTKEFYTNIYTSLDQTFGRRWWTKAT